MELLVGLAGLGVLGFRRLGIRVWGCCGRVLPNGQLSKKASRADKVAMVI